MSNSTSKFNTSTNNKSDFHYEINLFDIDVLNLSCYNLGYTELIFQSSKPPYNIQCLIFTKTLQNSQLLSFTNKSIKRIVANEFSFHFLTQDGILYSWELTGDTKQIKPKQMSYFDNIKIIDIAQSRTCTVCFDSFMNIYCWGAIGHLTGQPSHYSQNPVFLAKEHFSFNTALKKIVCGENYALFLDLAGEAFYCGHIQFNQSGNVANNNSDAMQPQIKHIEYKGCSDIDGGKNIVAFYDSNKNSVMVFNENIGLKEIEIQSYHMIKSTSIKFIDNSLFINAINDLNEYFIIEIYLNNISINDLGENTPNDNNNRGLMRIYKNEIDSLLLWSSYYTHALGFANVNNHTPSLKLLDEKMLNLTLNKTLQCNITIIDKPIKKDNPIDINNNNNNNKDNRISYRNIHNLNSIIHPSSNNNNNLLQGENSRSINATTKINIFKQKVFGSEDQTNEIINNNENDWNDAVYQTNFDKKIEKIKKLNKVSKSYKNMLNKNNNYTHDTNNHHLRNSSSQTLDNNNSYYSTLKDTIKGKIYKEIEQINSIDNKEHKHKTNGFIEYRNNKHRSMDSNEMRNINCLMESQLLQRDLYNIQLNNQNNDINNQSRRIKDFCSNKATEMNIKQVMSLRKKTINRNLTSKLKENSTHFFQSNIPIKPLSSSLIKNEIPIMQSSITPSYINYIKDQKHKPNQKHNQKHNQKQTNISQIINSSLKQTNSTRNGIGSCILNYLKEKGKSKDKKLI